MLAVRIQLPPTHEDERTDKFRVYRLLDTGQFSLLSEVTLGTELLIDIHTNYGCSYYYTAYDSESGNESSASPLARVFKKRSTTPYTV